MQEIFVTGNLVDVRQNFQVDSDFILNDTIDRFNLETNDLLCQ
jgi:hypothetical protein